MSQTPHLPAVNGTDRPVQEPTERTGLVSTFDPTAARVDVWTNLPEQNEAADVLLSVALGGECQPLSELGKRIIDLYAVVTHPVELVDTTTGEVTPAVRTVLIDTQGVCYSCCSETLRNSLGRIMSRKGPGPWHPPLRIQLSPGRSRRGFQIYRLTLASTGEPRMPWEPEPKSRKGV